MLTTILLLLLIGITFGLLLAIYLLFYFLKIKCPKCKQLKPVKEIVFVNWKERVITGRPCLKCRQIKPQIDIY